MPVMNGRIETWPDKKVEDSIRVAMWHRIVWREQVDGNKDCLDIFLKALCMSADTVPIDVGMARMGLKIMPELLRVQPAPKTGRKSRAGRSHNIKKGKKR